MRTTELACDVLVAGGGMAGVTAALAAARRGAKVVLLQDRPVLGGNASSEVRMHIVGADNSGKRGRALETEARESGLVEEIRLANSVRNAQRSPSMFDLILYDLCRVEPNLTLLLNTTLVHAKVIGAQVEHIIAERHSTLDRFTIRAAVFIDATGDSRLAHETGSPFMEGREARARFNESLAPEVADSKRLGSTIMFQARRHDRPMPFTPPSWARRFSEHELRLRPHGTGGAFGDLGLEYGYWWVEWGGELDTIRDNETIRDELLAILLGVWDHVKNGGEHGAEHWALEWCGFVPGKRESRRCIGQHVLTQNDVMQSTPFDDSIAYGGWAIDLHPPAGVDAPDEPPCVQHEVPHLYDIPLRVCVSATLDNLMFAGRNISATHVAFASTRVMATCGAIGQGVGTAAAYAARHQMTPARLAADRSAMTTIQQQLLSDDAYLLGRTHTDPRDLARSATVTASSEQPAGPATNVLSGVTRSVHGSDGAPPGRVAVGTHRWMSEPAQGLPAWLELRWPSAVRARDVQLIFDTGLHRVLTFSLADAYTERMCWARPQPEVVCDYSVECERQGVWSQVVRVTGNYQRRNVLALDNTPFDALRITITATGGLDHARLCEVRVSALS